MITLSGFNDSDLGRDSTGGTGGCGIVEEISSGSLIGAHVMNNLFRVWDYIYDKPLCVYLGDTLTVLSRRRRGDDCHISRCRSQELRWCAVSDPSSGVGVGLVVASEHRDGEPYGTCEHTYFWTIEEQVNMATGYRVSPAPPQEDRPSPKYLTGVGFGIPHIYQGQGQPLLCQSGIDVSFVQLFDNPRLTATASIEYV
jgi:hypothetical protein